MALSEIIIYANKLQKLFCRPQEYLVEQIHAYAYKDAEQHTHEHAGIYD